MMKKNQRTERSHTFHEKALYPFLIPFIALLAVYFLDDLSWS